MYDFAIIAFHVAVGFAIGGLIASFHQWATDRAPSFQDIGETFTEKLWSLALIVLGGPFIIMRNALRGRRIEGRPVGLGDSFDGHRIKLEFLFGRHHASGVACHPHRFCGMTPA